MPNARGDRARGAVMNAKPSMATMLVDLARATGLELFHTPDGEPFAIVPADDHQETWPIRSTGFKLWLRRIYFSTIQGTANTQAVEDALSTLEGQALFDGHQDDAHLRLAEADGRIYLDLADQFWRVVEIAGTEWRVLDRSPVRFRRPRGGRALPVPIRGGKLDAFRELRTDDDDTWRRGAGWPDGPLRAGRPFPVLARHGEQGAAKSTLAKMLRQMVDPNEADLRPCPRDEYDLILAARNGWIIGFDNVSEIKPWLSDVLCRVATGIGFGRRQLYTDGDEVLMAVKRPIVLNGIEDVAVNGDLIDRAIVATLPRIEEDRRREEDELWSAFAAAHPALLGALLDITAGALAGFPDVQLSRKPRMADFARWVTAAEPTLGWKSESFLHSYRHNRSRAATTALESSLVVDPLLGLLKDTPRYEGTISELLRQLCDQVQDRTVRADKWPKDATRLSGELRRLAPALRRAGVYMHFPTRTNKARRVIVWLRGHKTEGGHRASPASQRHRTTNGGAPRDAGVTMASAASVTPNPNDSAPRDAGDAGYADSPLSVLSRSASQRAGGYGSEIVACRMCGGTDWHYPGSGIQEVCATCHPPVPARDRGLT